MSQEENSFNDQVLTKLQVCFSVTQDTALDAGSKPTFEMKYCINWMNVILENTSAIKDKIAFRSGYSLKNVDDFYLFASREFQIKFDHCMDMK